MTFKRASETIDYLPAGRERGELQKMLTIFERVVDFAYQEDIVAIRQEVSYIAAVASGFPEGHMVFDKAPKLTTAQFAELQSMLDSLRHVYSSGGRFDLALKVSEMAMRLRAT